MVCWEELLYWYGDRDLMGGIDGYELSIRVQEAGRGRMACE